jgi:hypothetical protein
VDAETYFVTAATNDARRALLGDTGTRARRRTAACGPLHGEKCQHNSRPQRCPAQGLRSNPIGQPDVMWGTKARACVRPFITHHMRPTLLWQRRQRQRGYRRHHRDDRERRPTHACLVKLRRPASCHAADHAGAPPCLCRRCLGSLQGCGQGNLEGPGNTTHSTTKKAPRMKSCVWLVCFELCCGSR